MAVDNGTVYMNKDKLVSVIIPIYKVEAYLDRCIKSVVGQSYKNLEIILIDDGSTDNCGSMCDHFAETDSRIKVIHRENGGLSAARNSGLKIATGDYLFFFDSDDVIPSYAIEALLDACIKKSADVSVGDFKMFTSDIPDEDHLYNDSVKAQITTYSGSDMIRLMHTFPGERFVVMWGKLFKSSLFDGIEFPEGRINEDLATIYKVYDKTNVTAVIDVPVYWYFRANNNSITFELGSNFYQAVYTDLDEELEYLKNNNPDCIPYAERTYMYWIFDEYKKLYGKGERADYLKELYAKYCSIYDNCKHLPRERFFAFFRYAPKLYCHIRK